MSFIKRLKNKILGKQPKDEVLEKIQEVRESEISKKYDEGLEKSREGFFKKVKLFFVKKRPIDEKFFEEFEELMIMADVGYDYAIKLSKSIQNEVKLRNITDSTKILDLVVEVMYEIYMQKNKNENIKFNISKTNPLNVIMVSGVNGSGKTTSIGKITKKFKDEGYNVILAAGDTFRAGAVAQLQEWAKRLNVSIVVPEKDGQDPSSIVYKAIQEARIQNSNLLIIDTAGRLQNKQNLMAELTKMKKVILKELQKEPDETLLVIDATTGQNGILQAKGFNEATKITGIILSKMDSSSKGGIALSIKDMFDIPVKLIGLGEQLDDLKEFDINEYLYGLTKDILLEESI